MIFVGKNCRSYELHDFYCINCGEKGIPLARPNNKKKGAGHRKNMYCFHCKHTVNHVECNTIEEVEQFKTDFNNGLYAEEAKAELNYEKNSPRLSYLY